MNGAQLFYGRLSPATPLHITRAAGLFAGGSTQPARRAAPPGHSAVARPVRSMLTGRAGVAGLTIRGGAD